MAKTKRPAHAKRHFGGYPARQVKQWVMVKNNGKGRSAMSVVVLECGHGAFKSKAEVHANERVICYLCPKVELPKPEPKQRTKAKRDAATAAVTAARAGDPQLTTMAELMVQMSKKLERLSTRLGQVEDVATRPLTNGVMVPVPHHEELRARDVTGHEGA